MLNSPFVFLTYSLNIANLFIEGRLTQQDIADNPEAFLLSNQQANNTLLRFVHNYGFDDGVFIELSLLDPLSEFEGRFLTPNLKDQLAKLKEFTLKLAEEPTVRNLFADLKEISAPSNDDIRGKINKQVTSLLTQSNRLYIVYGNNAIREDWTGPFTAQITDVKSVASADGVRQINLRMIPSNSYFDIARIGLNKIQKVFPNSVGDTYFGAKIPVDQIATFSLDGPIKVLRKPSDIEGRFHEVITQLLEAYIKCLIGDIGANVFVVMPNLDYYLRDYYEVIKKKYSELVKADTAKNSILFWLEGEDADLVETVDYYGFFREVLGPLGIEVRFEEEPYEDFTEQKKIYNVNPLFTPASTKKIKVKPYFVMSQLYEEEFKMDKAKTLLKLIDNMVNFITENLTESIDRPEFDYFTETNTQLIELWYKVLDFVPMDKSKPVYIFGDPSLVLATFYGNASTGVRLAPEAPTTLSKRDTSIAMRCRNVQEEIYQILGVKTIREDDEPIIEFNMNVENPNILDLEIRNNLNLLATLGTDREYISEYLSVYANTSLSKNIYDRIFDSVNKEYKNNFKGFLTKIADSIKGTTTVANLEEGEKNPLRFTTEGQKGSNFVKQALEVMKDYFKLQLPRALRYTKLKFPSEKMYLAAQYEKFKKLQNFNFIIGVKTLPKFKYNSPAFLMKQPVAVSIRLPTITGVVSPSQDITNTYLSGVYVIRGFKHTISDSDMYSEFVLYKRVEHAT